MYLNVRASLRRDILSQENIDIFNSGISCRKSDKLGLLVVNDDDNKEYRDFYDRYKYVERIESYWLVYFLREWINELLLGYYKKILDQRDINLILTNGAWGFDHYLGGKINKKITSSMIEDRKSYSVYSISENPSKYKKFLNEILECRKEDTEELFAELSHVPVPVEIAPGLSVHTTWPLLNRTFT